MIIVVLKLNDLIGLFDTEITQSQIICFKVSHCLISDYDPYCLAIIGEVISLLFNPHVPILKQPVLHQNKSPVVIYLGR